MFFHWDTGTSAENLTKPLILKYFCASEIFSDRKKHLAHWDKVASEIAQIFPYWRNLSARTWCDP